MRCKTVVSDSFKQAAIDLWGLLDDISALDDAVKKDDAGFRKIAYGIAEKRGAIFTSDGYDLFTLGGENITADRFSVMTQAKAAVIKDAVRMTGTEIAAEIEDCEPKEPLELGTDYLPEMDSEACEEWLRKQCDDRVWIMKYTWEDGTEHFSLICHPFKNANGDFHINGTNRHMLFLMCVDAVQRAHITDCSDGVPHKITGQTQ